MFRTKKTKIVSAPVEEILEVAPREEFVAMDFARVSGQIEEFVYGTIVDYDGVEYEFEWDSSKKCLARLGGSKVDSMKWSSASQILLNQLAPSQEVPVDKQIQPLLQNELQKVTSSINSLGTRVEQALNSKPQAVQRVEIPKVEVPTKSSLREIIVAPEVREASSSDDDLALNALRFLQETGGEQVDIDYLSL
jgi:hypothetical protein